MELLLNLAWILLALPAYWLWRDSRTASRRFRPSHCLLALACTLVVLFPVISATDDLHAMRAEMEESPNGKRGCQSGSDRSSASKSAAQPALNVASTHFSAGDWVWYDVPSVGDSAVSIPPMIRATRGPPSLTLT
jgi:hypothetical protein